MSIFQNLRFLIVMTILLMSAICSCRSTRHTVTQTADSTAVTVTEVKESVSVDDILSVINASTDIELAGITVEFFPPDSARPVAPADPLPCAGTRAPPVKSLKIESAKARNNTKAARHEEAVSIGKDTVNVNIDHTAATAQDTRSDSDILRPSDRVVFFSILAAIIILFIILILIIKSKRHDNAL